MNGARFFAFYGSNGKRISSFLLALLWFDGLWFNGASPDGLGCGDGGLLRICAITSHLVVGCGGLVWWLSSLIKAWHFVDLRCLQLLLLLFREELVSGLEHFRPLFGLKGRKPK